MDVDKANNAYSLSSKTPTPVTSRLPEGTQTAVDDAYKYLDAYQGDDLVQNGVTERRLLRKLDIHLVLPMLWAYTSSFLDRSILNYASSMGLNADLRLEGNDFSNVSSVFSATVTAFALVQGFLLYFKAQPNTLLAVNVTLWGIFTALTATATDYKGLLAFRIVVGACEAAIVPCQQLILGRFYHIHDQTTRFTWWYAGLGLGQIFGAALSAAFQEVGNNTFHGWQAMFILFGVQTALAGICIYIFIPGTPMEAKFLSDTEKRLVLENVKKNKTGVSNKRRDPAQLLEILQDPQIYLMMAMITLLSSASGVVNTYSSTLLRNYGFSSQKSTLLTIPGGVISLLLSVASGFGVQKTGHRLLWIAGLAFTSSIGAGLLAFEAVDHRVGMLTGLWLIYFDTTTVILAYQLAAANIAGQSKRAVSLGLLECTFGLGTVIGPLTFRAQDAPYYFPARLALFVMLLAGSICSLLLWTYYTTINKTRQDRRAASPNADPGKEGWYDLTDRRDETFQYWR